MIAAKLYKVFQIAFFRRARDSIFQKRDGILCTREQFDDLFPELRMFVKREAMAGKVEELFVFHIRIARNLTNYTEKKWL